MRSLALALLLAPFLARASIAQEPATREGPGPASAELRDRAHRALAAGAFDEAERLVSRAIEIDRQSGAEREVLVDLQISGDVAFFAARYATALDRYRDAEALALALGEGRARPAILANQGALLAVLGRHVEARETLERALGEAERMGDRPRAAYVLLNQGMLESASGRYGEALRRMQRAADEWRALGDGASEGRALSTSGGVYSEIGLSAEAEAALARALALFDEASAPGDHGRTLRLIGLSRLDAGRAAEALEPLDRSIVVLRRAKDSWGVASAVRFRGMALLRLGRAEEAEAAFREALDLAGSVRDPFEAALAKTGLAESLEAGGKRAEAETTYREVLAESDPLRTPEASWRARLGLGRTREAARDAAGALEAYLAAIEEVEAIRSLLGAPALRVRYLGDKLELYRRAARLLAREGRDEESFRMAEAGKARTLLEVSAVRPIGAPEPIRLPEAEAARLRSAEERIRSLELRMADAARGEAERAALAAEIGEARAAHAEALLRAELADPEAAILAGIAASPSLAEVRAGLPDRSALLEFLVGAEGSAVWVVRRGGAWFRELDATEEEIEAWIGRILSPIEGLRAGRTDVANLGFDAAAAAALHARLLGPIAGLLEGCDRLLVVPDGALRRLPFSLLVTRAEKRPVDPSRLYAQYEGLRFLVEEVAIGVLPTAGILLAPRGSTEGATRGLVLADPAPPPRGATPLRAARAEADSIRRAFGAIPVEVLAGEEATEARVRAAPLDAAVLHFAAHASLDDARPAYSSVALAPGEGEDGRLHAYEVERLRAPDAQVVLSACETIGSAGRGEGLLGLSRAFLLAGARGVVASAWVVDDAATASLMERYYAALAEGGSPSFALRRAQTEILEAARRSGSAALHPFYWAGFVAVGFP